MKTWIIVVFVVLGLGVAVMTGLFLSQKSKTAKASIEKAEAIALAAKNDSIAGVNLTQALQQKDYKEEAQQEASNLKAELDTIKPLALVADSLKQVAAELQKQLAACATKKGGKVSKTITATTGNAVTETPVQLAKRLKGNPLINDVDKTFMFVTSDKKDSTLMAKAPKGYKLIEKPR